MRYKHNERRCSACVYYESCAGSVNVKTAAEECEYYDPVDDDSIDLLIQDMLEAQKDEYTDAWREYVQQYADGNREG